MTEFDEPPAWRNRNFLIGNGIFLIGAILGAMMFLCTPAPRNAYIECWSGDERIYAGRSKGDVRTSWAGSIAFIDAATGQRREILGDCSFSYE